MSSSDPGGPVAAAHRAVATARAFVRAHPQLEPLVPVLRAGRRWAERAIDGPPLPPVPPLPDGRPTRLFRLRLPARPGSPVEPVRRLVVQLPEDMYVAKRLAKLGLAGYEPETMACFLAAMDLAGPGAVLDVGANVGVYGVVAAALSDRRVLAFEPTPDLAAAAWYVSARNRLGVQVIPVALGARRDIATFYLSDSTDSSNSLAAGFRPSTRQIQVQVEPLTPLLRRRRIVPAVMKIDTETTEADVIAGARQLIRRHRPWIFCEVLAGRADDRIDAAMRPFGYTCYPVGDELPLRPEARIAGDPTHRHLMWLFAPEPLTDAFTQRAKAWRERIDVCLPRS